jgi:hypothetical protein
MPSLRRETLAAETIALKKSSGFAIGIEFARDAIIFLRFS